MTFRSDHAKGLFLTTLGVIILTPDALLIRLIETGTWTLVFWRGLLMGAALGLYVFASSPKTAIKDFTGMSKVGLLGACLFGLNNVMFMVSITNTAAANTLVILGAMPLFAAIFGFIALKERLPLSTWLAIFIGFGGIVIIFMGSFGTDGLFGDIAAAITACGMAAALTCFRYDQRINTLAAISIGSFLSAIVGLFLADSLTVNNGDIFYLALLCAVILPVAMGLITIGPRYIPAAEVGLLMLMEMALGPLWVWLGVGEVPSLQTVIGGTVILVTLGAHSAWALKKEAPAR
jgi:drug/metabolite transporter (DMT)-like permease